MGRKKRVWYEGACYHVMARGNRRGAIFKEKDDYSIFLKLLSQIKIRFPFELHAYCLMTNHFHLEITTLLDPIWIIMKPIMNHYARTFNMKYGFEGHLFDSRYNASLITDDIYFLEVSRYIHLNPVKAAMVREPLSYEYSSYRFYVTDETWTELTTDRVFGSFGKNERENYRMFVEGRLSHREQELLIQKDIGEDEMWLPGDTKGSDADGNSCKRFGA